MSKRPVIIVLHQLGGGGVTNAVLDQSQLFAQAGHPTSIVTFGFDAQFDDSVRRRREQGRLHPDVAVLNPYEHAKADAPQQPLVERLRRRMDRDAPGRREARVAHRQDEPGYERRTTTDQYGELSRYYDADGQLVKQKRRSPDGRLRTETGYVDGTVSLRHDFDSAGRLASKVVFDPGTGLTLEEQYFTAEGTTYMVRPHDPVKGVARPLTIFGRSGDVVHRGIKVWQVDFLRKVVAQTSGRPIIIAESPSAIPKVATIAPDTATRLGMLHNNQFAAPFVPGSDIRNDHKAVFDALPSLDGLIVLTPQQRDDVVALFGHAGSIHVVPNLRADPGPREGGDQDGRLVTIVSRLAAQKAIHEAIHAFALVVDEVPDARLEIYGQGPTKAELATTISSLGLQANVRLMGRVDGVDDIMARSVCTVSSSDWEAMPLSIIESHAVATPVVAYDCLYGPQALIDDGRTGRIVPRGDRAALAAAIVDLLKDPEKAGRMGRAARAQFEEHHTAGPVLRRWEEVLTAF